MTTSPKTSICFINNDFLKISIKLSLSKPVAAGANFKIYKDNTQECIEEIKMNFNNGGYETAPLKTQINLLNRATMSITILTCSTNPLVNDCKFLIEIISGDQKLRVVEPAEFTVTNLPPCKINNPSKINGQITFLVIKK